MQAALKAVSAGCQLEYDSKDDELTVGARTTEGGDELVEALGADSQETFLKPLGPVLWREGTEGGAVEGSSDELLL